MLGTAGNCPTVRSRPSRDCRGFRGLWGNSKQCARRIAAGRVEKGAFQSANRVDARGGGLRFQSLAACFLASDLGYHDSESHAAHAHVQDRSSFQCQFHSLSSIPSQVTAQRDDLRVEVLQLREELNGSGSIRDDSTLKTPVPDAASPARAHGSHDADGANSIALEELR